MTTREEVPMGVTSKRLGDQVIAVKICRLKIVIDQYVDVFGKD